MKVTHIFSFCFSEWYCLRFRIVFCSCFMIFYTQISVIWFFRISSQYFNDNVVSLVSCVFCFCLSFLWIFRLLSCIKIIIYIIRDKLRGIVLFHVIKYNARTWYGKKLSIYWYVILFFRKVLIFSIFPLFSFILWYSTLRSWKECDSEFFHKITASFISVIVVICILSNKVFFYAILWN